MSFLSSLFGKSSSSKPKTPQEYQEMLSLGIEKLNSSKSSVVELLYLLSSDESVQNFRKKVNINFKKEDGNTLVLASQAQFDYDIRIATNFKKRSISLFDLVTKTFDEIQKNGILFLKTEGYKYSESDKKDFNNFLGKGYEIKFYHTSDPQKTITVTFTTSQKPFITIFHTELIFNV